MVFTRLFLGGLLVFFLCLLLVVFFWDVVFCSLVDTLVISDFGFL